MTTSDTPTSPLTRKLVPDQLRMQHVADLFGIHFPMRMEPFVFSLADELSPDYSGSFWAFYELSNGGFYMTPDSNTIYSVTCENGFQGHLSADALGITVCLYAYSHLSFGGDAFAETCAQHYQMLREYMFEHPEVGSILQAID